MRRVAITLAVVLAVFTVHMVGAARAGQQNVDKMTYAQLDRAAQKEIQRGGIRGVGWGAASPWLKSLCYEMVDRQFAPYGTQRWARYIVNRESGCNPGAVNLTYDRWDQQARGIAQLIPAIHTWVNYARLQKNLRYAVAVFLRLSKGGRSTAPWAY